MGKILNENGSVYIGEPSVNGWNEEMERAYAARVFIMKADPAYTGLFTAPTEDLEKRVKEIEKKREEASAKKAKKEQDAFNEFVRNDPRAIAINKRRESGEDAESLRAEAQELYNTLCREWKEKKAAEKKAA